MNALQRRLAIVLLCSLTIHTMPPLGLFAPYDINIKPLKPSAHHFQVNFLGEKSYNVQGYATDAKEEKTFLVNPLQIYEPTQNIVSLYQGYDANGSLVQTITTPFTQLLDSIAGGAGGGVSNLNNGIFKPTGTLSAGQFSVSTTYGFGQGFYISAFLPVYFAKLTNVCWKYDGTNTLFSDQVIQEELIDSFAQDALTYFDLNIGNWKQHGLGDATMLFEWQRDFIQRRPTLRSVQINARIGLSVPTGRKACENIILPVAFGGDGAVGIPFGGGIMLNLGNIVDVGVNGQFWYYWSNEKYRRLKTFPTQTSLLYPIVTNTYKEYSIIQNFNLHGQFYSFCKRFTLKGIYQYWRKGKDMLTPLVSTFNFDIVNSAPNLDESTRHQVTVLAAYAPHADEFKHCFPQFEIFWKVATNGMRAAIASTYGAQLSLTF